MRLKNGVSLVGLQPEMGLASQVVSSVYYGMGYDCIITSGTEQGAQHMENSLHWKGLALDFRIRHLPKYLLTELADKLTAALGSEFDVILHNSHIHVEHDV